MITPYFRTVFVFIITVDNFILYHALYHEECNYFKGKHPPTPQ
jgi:hypothetical protein